MPISELALMFFAFTTPFWTILIVVMLNQWMERKTRILTVHKDKNGKLKRLEYKHLAPVYERN